MDNPLDEIDNVTLIADFFAPVVRVIYNAAVLVRGNGVAFDDPIQCRFAVYGICPLPCKCRML